MNIQYLAALFCWTCCLATAAAERPNVILLMADDLGYSGLGCYGSDLHETPHLDRLARQAMRFDDAYSACTVCSPTRASVMTGKYPARLHLTDFIAGQNRPFSRLTIPRWTKRLELGEVTIAEALRSAGYATALVGKWHLGPRGGDAADYDPRGQGFDLQVLKPPQAKGYYLPQSLIDQGKAQHRYLTDHLTDEALGIIDRWQDRPFFLYFPYHTPHTPIQGQPELIEYYRDKIKPGLRHSNPTYAAMVHSLDESVGRILEKLQQVGIAERTIVIFTSDNGGLTQRFGKPTGYIDNYPLRRGKGSAYEGGVRVPLIVRWPGVTQPGSRSNEPVCTIDFYRTILEMTATAADPRHNSQVDGAQLNGAQVDGASLVKLLKDPAASLEREALYWHYPHYHAGGDGPYGAVRAGPWRLIEFYEQMNVELYHLQDDPGERHNLAAKLPDKVDQLRGMLHLWRESVSAQMPTPNPDFDADKARREAAGLKVQR